MIIDDPLWKTPRSELRIRGKIITETLPFSTQRFDGRTGSVHSRSPGPQAGQRSTPAPPRRPATAAGAHLPADRRKRNVRKEVAEFFRVFLFLDAVFVTGWTVVGWICRRALPFRTFIEYDLSYSLYLGVHALVDFFYEFICCSFTARPWTGTTSHCTRWSSSSWTACASVWNSTRTATRRPDAKSAPASLLSSLASSAGFRVRVLYEQE